MADMCIHSGGCRNCSKEFQSFLKMKIEVCENKEFSHFFIQIPFYIYATHLIQLVPYYASKHKEIIDALLLPCHHQAQ